VTTVTDLAGSNPDEYIFFNGARHAWRASTPYRAWTTAPVHIAELK
jgi:hypothetical protein